MAVGKPLYKQDIDNNIANFGIQLANLAAMVAQYAKTLDALADAAFTATGFPKSASDPTVTQYTAGELTQLRNAYRDLNKFFLVYAGSYYVAAGATVNAGVPTANDATHFGYPFSMAVSAIDGLGF